ncbi:Sialidase-4 [Fukomys damarensis]|uniref:exo-alpha-sialidase n=2 Tax=Fukomys damarensis TaxID=885580 RepID=A0A091CWJ8_FUKDA|nr:Sialidase-4 [Fukomys damarensis]
MGAPRAPARTVLFRRERTGLTYRVPALLSIPPRAILLAFAEQRHSPDDAHAHRLVLRRGALAGGAMRWGALRVLATAALEEHRSMNPCPVLDAGSGTIFLFFIAVLGHTPEAVQIATGRNAARLCCVTSRDSGLTWGGPRDLTEETLGAQVQDWATFAVGPGHGVQLRSGRLLVPAYTYRVDRRECFGKVCWTSSHSFAIYSDDQGRTWHCGGLVPNLRSGECQLAAVDGGFLYCNARSPLGSRVQALSTDEGTSFLPAELVPTLAETARGCQGSIIGFLAPALSKQEGPNPPCLCPRVQDPINRPFCHPQPWKDSQEQPGLEPGLGDGETYTPMLSLPSVVPEQSSTWLLYSHPVGERARLRMGIYLSRSPTDTHSWTEPWVIFEGPSGYSDLATLGSGPGAALAFACLFESGARASYEDISFCMFSLREVLENVLGGPKLLHREGKPWEHCRPF